MINLFGVIILLLLLFSNLALAKHFSITEIEWILFIGLNDTEETYNFLKNNVYPVYKEQVQFSALAESEREFLRSAYED